MRPRRKVREPHRVTLSKPERWKWDMFLIPRCWIVAVCLYAVLPCCSSVHVFVRDEKRYAVLFQSVVLPCQYTSVSTQTPVVQWVYKSYCRDRTRDSFSFSDTLGGGVAGGVSSTGTGYNGHGGYGTHGSYGGTYETGTASYLDCADSSRTVRTVASVSGSSITLSEYYKNRDISITNKADLRIGEVQWGDSGVYICKVIISDDLEGQNEASVELLVLGLSAVPEDLLPGFDLKIMPEWVFVTAVALGSVLFLLLVGICWCQCCPHSCCCYVSCWCCPDTCCCPRHLYEAGKGIKTAPSSPVYPPYFVTGVPAMVPIAPPSLVDKASVSVPPSDATLVTVPVHSLNASYSVDQNSLRVLQYVEKQLAHFNPARSTSLHSSSASELSSLHEGENNFRKTFRNVQKKALPAILDVDSRLEPEPQRSHGNPPSPQRYQDDTPSLTRHRDSPAAASPPQHYRHRPPSPQRYHHNHQNTPSLERHRDSPASSHRFHDNPSRRYQNKPPSPQRYRKDPPSPQRFTKDPPSPKRFRGEPVSETIFKQNKPLVQRRYSDDPPGPAHNRRAGPKVQPEPREAEHRWNPRSEHLQRKTYRSGERTVSLDELEEFAFSYSQRRGRGMERGAEEQEHYQESDERNAYDSRLTQRYHTDETHMELTSAREDYPRGKNRRDISPLASPKNRRGTWDTDCPVPPPPPRVSPPSSSSQEKDYDPAFLNSLLDRKSKLRGVGLEKSMLRGDGGSDAPSKSSCTPGSGEGHRHSPNNRPDGDSLLYSDTERKRSQSPPWRHVPVNCGSPQPSALVQPGRRDDTREKPRKMNTLLSRDSLIV